jgi:hypothetical protein
VAVPCEILEEGLADVVGAGHGSDGDPSVVLAIDSGPDSARKGAGAASGPILSPTSSNQACAFRLATAARRFARAVAVPARRRCCTTATSTQPIPNRGHQARPA